MKEEILIQAEMDLPDPMRHPEFWIKKSLTDLFFLCTNVLSHNKALEYRDLNWIHRDLCDFVDQEKDPYLQKLILMFRDGLKSSIARADIIQWFIRKSYRDRPGKVGIFCGIYELGQDNLDKIMNEVFSNELLQTFFYKYLPSKKADCRVCSNEKVRFKDIEIDIGSPKRPLTGHHFEGIVNDNLCNEANTATLDLRKFIVRRWQQQESLLSEKGSEKIYETTWEMDDLSGVILDPDGRFDYKRIYRKPANIFISSTGYKVFSCPARDQNGQPVFYEKVDEIYLQRKRRKQGPYVYSRMYELQPIPDEEQVLKLNWLQHYEQLPYNFIRTLVVDCAGVTTKDSSHSAISLVDWDELGRMFIPFAAKKRVTPLELYRWMKEVIEWSEKQDKRPVAFVGIEKEKYGIYLMDIINTNDRNILIWPIDIRGRPREKRIAELVPYYEQGKIFSKPGLRQYEEEYREYYKGKEKDVDILDTLAYQLDIKTIPKKLPVVTEFVPNVDDEARKQFAKERFGGSASLRQRINTSF